VITHPRKMVRRGDYYGPEPRKLSTIKPQDEGLHRAGAGELTPQASLRAQRSNLASLAHALVAEIASSAFGRLAMTQQIVA
jgi:hypothetical protein